MKRASATLGHGWIQSYVDWAADTTDAPRIYHWMVGLTVLGMAMGNRCSIQGWGGHRVFPNLYLLLLSPSGFYRKSTAANIGTYLLDNLDDSTETGFRISEKFTPQTLFQDMAKKQVGLILWNEFSGALHRLHRDYMAGALEDLTDLYDSPSKLVSRTIGRGTEVITTPCLSIIGCSTKDWLTQSVKRGDLQGGFLSRFLYVSVNPSDKEKWVGEPVPPLSHTMREELLTTLRVLTSKKGIADFRECAEQYNTWLEYQERMVNDNLVNSNLIGFHSRQGLHVKKLAFLLQASLTPGDPFHITDEALSAAIYLFDGLVSSATSTIEDIDWDVDAQSLRQIKTLLAQAGGEMTRTDLVRGAKMRHVRLDELIRTLQQSGEIALVQKKTGERGRPSLSYHLVGSQPDTVATLDEDESDYLAE